MEYFVATVVEGIAKADWMEPTRPIPCYPLVLRAIIKQAIRMIKLYDFIIIHGQDPRDEGGSKSVGLM
jgi:hypothetical protein